jgi:hypothetical protein
MDPSLGWVTGSEYRHAELVSASTQPLRLAMRHERMFRKKPEFRVSLPVDAETSSA